jgi:hypothetical protein
MARRNTRRRIQMGVATRGPCMPFDPHPIMIADRCDVGNVTMNVLPDDVLLGVFDCYVGEATDVEGWHTLVHVCRQWRNVVFGSPRRLHLRIVCTNKSRVRKRLDIWPRLPIVVSGYCDSMTSLNNFKAALEHSDRVCQIELMVNAGRIPVKDVFAALEKPFPALIDLHLSQWPYFGVSSYLNSFKFLGGSNHLRSLSLGGIAIPVFRMVLRSSMDLNNLHLHDISCYMSHKPDTMATALSALTGLETLSLRFESKFPAYLGNQASLHPLPRSVIPSLLCFDFEGDSEYLEALVARIDTPVLGRLGITIFYQHTLDTTQLLWFLSRIPKMQEFDKARVKLDNPEVWIDFSSSDFSALRFGISSNNPEGHFPYLVRFFDLPFNPISTLESLYIFAYPNLQQNRWDRGENAEWLDLLEPFVAVKNLHLSKEVTPRIAPALQELVGERATEVFPTLQNVFLEEFRKKGPVYNAIMQFATARRLSGHPIHISDSH